MDSVTMDLLTLAFSWAVFGQGLLTVLFIAVGIIMVLTVLIQKPQGGGLSGAFGGGSGSGQTAFGTKTGDALTVFTIIVFVVFLGLAIGMNYVTRPVAADATETSAESTEQPGTAAPGTDPAATTPPTTGPTTGETPAAGTGTTGTGEAPKPETPAVPSPTPTAPTPTPAPAETPAVTPATTPGTSPGTDPATAPK